MRTKSSRTVILFLCIFTISVHTFPQGFGRALTFQGVDHFSAPSAVSRSLGGISFGSLKPGIGSMFNDPASLQGLTSPQISVGAGQYYSTSEQRQQYSPLKYYSNFSLLLEGLTGVISNPTTYDTTTVYQAKDSVQRPFDTIGPNWSAKQPHSSLPQLFVAAPFKIGDYALTVGAGMAEYSDLTWTFQNNNVLSPSVLSVNPSTTTIPGNNLDTNSIPVRWYQYAQSRTGSIRSYGGAVAVNLTADLSFGVTGQIL